MSAHDKPVAAANKADLWWAWALSLAAGLAFYPFAALRLDAHHDGIVLKPALDVLSGQVLFRDTFTQYGPLTSYLQALALGIDPRLLSIRILSVVAQAGALGFFFLAWRAVLPRPLAVLGAVMFIAHPMFYYPMFVMLPWSSTLALFFQSVAMLALVRLVGGGAASAGWAWILGAACACTFWCRQPVGGFLIISVAACAAGLGLTGWRHPRDGWRCLSGRVLAGGVVVTTLILGHLVIYGAFGHWWEQNVLWPRRWAEAAGDSMFLVFLRNLFAHESTFIVPLALGLVFLPSLIRRVRPGLSRQAEPLWWLALLAGYWLGGDRWVRNGLLQSHVGWSVWIIFATVVLAFWILARAGSCRWGGKPVSGDYHLAAVVIAVGAASLPQIYPMTSANHVNWATAPAIGILLYAVKQASGLGGRECTLGLLLLFSVTIHEKYRWGLFTATQPFVRLDSPAVMRGMHVEPEMAEAIAQADEVIARVLAAEPNVEVMMYGDDALYLTWFKNRENPATPFYVTWSMLLTEKQLAHRWNYLLMRRPVVLLNGASAAELKCLPGDYALVFHEPSLDLRILLPLWLREKMGER